MLSFFPRDDEIWDLIESVSEDFPSHCCKDLILFQVAQNMFAYDVLWDLTRDTSK